MWKLPVHGRPRLQNLRDISLLKPTGQGKSRNHPGFKEWGSGLCLLVGAAAENLQPHLINHKIAAASKPSHFSTGEQKGVSQGNGSCSPVEGN